VFSDFVCFRSSGRPPGVSPPGGLRPHRLPDSRNPRFFCDLFFGNLCALFLMVGQWDRLCYSVGPLRCFAGCGTRLPFILFMLSFIHSVHSVCIHCKDSIPGCTGGNNCPTISDVNTNAQLFSTNSLGSIPKTTNLLPASLMQHFSRNVMESIVAIACAPVGDTNIDWTADTYRTSGAVISAALYV